MKLRGEPKPIKLTPSRVFTFNRELGVHTFNIPAWLTCPGRTAFCAAECYACNGNFIRYDNVRRGADARWELTADIPTFLDLAERGCAYLMARGYRHLRIHSAGDFYSVDYFRAWLEVARACPEMHFFTYTRTWRLPSMRAEILSADIPSNFSLWWSTDDTMTAGEVALAESHWPLVAYIDGGKGYSRRMPAQNCGKQQAKGTNCLQCARCFHPQPIDAVTFLLH